MLNKALRFIERFIPKKLYKLGQPIYHFSLATVGAIIYRFPARHLKVLAVTGTKGKTSTAEMINAILEEAGKKTALAGTLRFKIATDSRPNKSKMTVPGRFFLQKFLRDAVDAGCTHAVLEMSSEAAKQFRHKWISLDALVFTNLAPEHIESHGSYEKYVDAKLSIARALSVSWKKDRVLVVNADDKEAEKFLAVSVPNKVTYSLSDAKHVVTSEESITFTYKDTQFVSHLVGQFNIYNMLAAIRMAEFLGIDFGTMKIALGKLKVIRGRAERIEAGQDFKVIVDYAHTPDSLRAVYEAFNNSKKILVLGATGGGRDIWKRKEMAQIADQYGEYIILTDEDPYEDDPRAIVDDLAQYFTKHKPEIIMDRRKAIARAINLAQTNDAVIITGKGTDPYIMRAGGVKEPWSDAEVAREELKKL